jgi:hypothetical protein
MKNFSPAMACWMLFLTACNSTETDAPLKPQSDVVVSSCIYNNPFSRMSECRNYTGKGWDQSTQEKNCTSQKGTYQANKACAVEPSLGTCLIGAQTPEEYVIVFSGDKASSCAATRMGCETFASGVFTASNVCDTQSYEPPPSFSGDENVFRMGELQCQDPLASEPPGTQNGQVCTRSMISACTEEGRDFSKYASCSTVLTQRPYWPAPPNTQNTTDIGQRLRDSGYMQEVAWVKEQVKACACVCCHSSETTPNGPSNWYIEAQPIWVDSFNDTGLALAAGWVDSSSFGAYKPEENNGFDRSVSGIPTTDNARMVRFFEAELARRGLSKSDFANTPGFGGPLVDQMNYVPTPCTQNEGVDANNQLRWQGGPARYLYVLEEGSKNPGVPPNLDLPEGTLWKLDVLPDSAPVASGLMYGSVPQGAVQKYPSQGAPAPLVSGKNYYVYVLADIGIPVTRCVFQAP